ncbi:MAG: hypothetical protein JWL96_224 [Sphingomonas bacterium]|uniref:cytochrome b/b6 domain-containing protein n=1 Tax=Sphingomonas bacterium TaxID=1895847 RepID=UPI00260AB45B|nr:cytochrome b/b6 domain-containing protein [Sphingomonas bacterium]MDB5708154.1 hypothetical protein [Sphingomonas bacterium]
MDISHANFVTGPRSDPAPAVSVRAVSYSAVAIALHWIIALCILGQIALGWRLHDIAPGPDRFVAFQLHKSIGITILLLSVARLAWRLVHPAPPEMPMPRWQHVTSRLVHWGLYGIMIGLPLTGWIMVSTSKLPIPTRLYGMVPWPAVPGFTGLSPATKAAWNGASNTGHTLLVFVTVAMLALHLGAVAKHQFVDRDGVLARMAPGAKSGWKEPRLWIAAGLALAAILIGHNILGGSSAGRHEHEQARAAAAPVVAVAPVAAADAPVAAATPAQQEPKALPPHWRMQDGTLHFATTWSGAAIAGGFSRWSPEIIFSPDDLARSSLAVRIDVTSVSTGDSQRDAALPTADWFDTATHPSAIFRSRNIRSAGGDSYVAVGTLDLRGVRHSVSVPFSVKIANGSATAQGGFTIDRTLFGVGQGEWSATDQIPAGVRVSFAIRANAPR